jgi:hypothetical protein
VIGVVRGRVYTVKEFVGWFKRQVASEMGCREVDVTAVGVYAGGALIAFKCDGKKYLAKIRSGRRFRVSVYEYIYENGRLVGIGRFKLHKAKGGSFKVYDKYFGPSDSVLFYVADNVNVDVYEYQYRNDSLLEPSGDNY